MSSDSPANPADSTPEAAVRFTPVAVRARHDGWRPAKQVAFIQALAETACVEDACRRVGMSQQSAYALRTRPDAVSFRQAWDIAIQHGAVRLTDKAMARAMNGVAVPVFYKGEKIGERRVFNERLTQFLLRAHLPERYGAWRDKVVHTRPPDGSALLFQHAIRAVAEDALADQAGRPRPKRDLLPQFTIDAGDGDERDAASSAMNERHRAIYLEQEGEIERLHERLRQATSGADGAPIWPTSAPSSTQEP